MREMRELGRLALSSLSLLAGLAGAPVAAAELGLPPPVAALVVSLASASEADDSETLVDIPDPALRRALEEALDKAVGDPINRGEMATLSGLRAGGVRDIAGIEYAANLTSLSLFNGFDGFNGAISDVSALAGLTSLTYLNLEGNEIADLSPLSGLTSLTYLSLDGNEVADLSPLSGLTSLTRLMLGWNSLSDISPLANLTSLTSLSLNAISGGLSDLSPLAGLTSLVDLSLSWNSSLPDLSPLAGLTSLRRLYMSSCDSLDLGTLPLSGFTSLETLRLGNSAIGDLSALSGMTSLTTLYAWGSAVSDISPLADLTSLRELSLRSNGIADVSPLSGLTSLTVLYLDHNGIADVSPLVANAGLGQGDAVYLQANPLRRESREMHIPTLLQRGVEVEFDPPLQLPGMPDVGLREAVEQALVTGNRTVATMVVLEASSRRIENLTGLGEASQLRGLFLDRNRITGLAPLSGLALYALTLAHNTVADLAPLTVMESLRYLALDGNSLDDLPPLPPGLRHLYLWDNSLSDIDSLADLRRLIELDVDGNSIASLAPLAGHNALEYLHASDNQVSDLSPLNFESLKELHFRDNAVRDISPLLRGDELLMVDARRNPLADDALAVLDALRERRVTVLAGETVPYFPAAGGSRQGFVRVVNRSDEDGHMFVEAVDDAGVRAPRARLQIGARQAVHFNSEDLENGSAAVGLAGIGPPTAGDWRPMAGSLLVRPRHALTLTARALEETHGLGDGRGKWRLRTRGFPWFAMSLLESPAGHLANLSTAPSNGTPLADGGTLHRLPLFPAAGGPRQGFARVVNRSYASGTVSIEAVDDGGDRFGPLELALRPRRAAHFNAADLEAGSAAKGWGGVGGGRGDWRLELASELDLTVLGYARTADGFVTGVHDLAPVAEDGSHRVAFFNPGSNARQASRLRLINDGGRAAQVAITGIDDRGNDSGTVALQVPAGAALALASAELEAGSERIAGRLGDGAGKWRLRVRSDEPISVMSLLETPSGHLANVSTGTA